MTEQGPKVNIEGLADAIFDGLAGVIGVTMTLATAHVFYKNEYRGANKELSNDMNDINEYDDTVYVTAPDSSLA